MFARVVARRLIHHRPCGGACCRGMRTMMTSASPLYVCIVFSLILFQRCLTRLVVVVLCASLASRSLPVTQVASVPALPSAIVPFCGDDAMGLMAVPKKKPSHQRRRERQHGHRLVEERKNPIVQYELQAHCCIFMFTPALIAVFLCVIEFP